MANESKNRTVASLYTELFDGIIKSESVTVGGLRYDIVDDCAVVAPLQADTISGNVNIPAQITYQNKTYAVTAIAGCAFYNNDTITVVTIPESVTEIGEVALYSCGSLTRISFNGTIAQWGKITKPPLWDEYTDNYTVYCTDGEIAKD